MPSKVSYQTSLYSIAVIISQFLAELNTWCGSEQRAQHLEDDARRVHVGTCAQGCELLREGVVGSAEEGAVHESGDNNTTRRCHVTYTAFRMGGLPYTLSDWVIAQGGCQATPKAGTGVQKKRVSRTRSARTIRKRREGREREKGGRKRHGQPFLRSG